MQTVLELPPLQSRDPGAEESEVAMVRSGIELLQELATSEPASVVSVQPDFYNQWARAPRPSDLPPPQAPPTLLRPITKDASFPRDRTRTPGTPSVGARGNPKSAEERDRVVSKASQTGDAKGNGNVLAAPVSTSLAVSRGDLVAQRSAPPRCTRTSGEQGLTSQSAAVPTRKCVSTESVGAEKVVGLLYPPRTPAYASRTAILPSTPTFPMMDALEYIGERLSLRSAGESGRASGEAALSLEQQRRAMSRSQQSRRVVLAKPPSLLSPPPVAPKPLGGPPALPATAASIPSGHPVFSNSICNGSGYPTTPSACAISGRLLTKPNPPVSTGYPTNARSLSHPSRKSASSDAAHVPGSHQEYSQTPTVPSGHLVSLKPGCDSGECHVLSKTPSPRNVPPVASTLGVVDFLEMRRQHMPVRSHSSSHRQHNLHRLHQYQQYFRSHRPRTHNIQLSRAAHLHQRPKTEGSGAPSQGRRDPNQQPQLPQQQQLLQPSGRSRYPIVSIPTGRGVPSQGSEECLTSVKINVRNSSHDKI